MSNLNVEILNGDKFLSLFYYISFLVLLTLRFLRKENRNNPEFSWR
jgi:hypothetical protein